MEVSTTLPIPTNSRERRFLREIGRRGARLRRMIEIGADALVIQSTSDSLAESLKRWEIEVAYAENEGRSSLVDQAFAQIERPAEDQTRRARRIRQAPEGESRGGCAMPSISETAS